MRTDEPIGVDVVNDPPTKLQRFSDTGLAPEGDDGLAPMEIVARVFERPFTTDLSVETEIKAPPQGATKPTNVSIAHHHVAVANKVTPEMLLAIVASIIATSATAALAVARIRLEVAGWTFETSTGQRG